MLDAAFPGAFDFAQDVGFGEGGETVVTRWSGAVHVVDPHFESAVRIDLPEIEPDGIYYSAALHGGRICATYCSGLSVVCAPLR